MTLASLSRRTVLRAAAGAAGATWLSTGCAAPLQGRGPAFAPWDFPGDETRPEFLAVRAAVLAASPHNTQPWLFRVTPDAIDVFADQERWLGPMDSLRRELYLGLGCAIENAVLAARAHGRAVQVTLRPGDDERHAATLALTPAPAVGSELYDALPERRNNKYEYASTPVPTSVLDGLRALVDDERLQLRVVTEPTERARLRQQTIDAVVALTNDREMAERSHLWWRQTTAEVEATRDGLNLDIMGLDAFTVALAGSVSTVSVTEANGYWVDATRGRHTTGAGWLVIGSRDRKSRTEQLLAGRLFQRVHLFLTTRGVDLHTVNMMPELQDREETTAAAARPFTAACQEWMDGGFQMLARFGYAFEAAVHTPRRAVEAVLR